MRLSCKAILAMAALALAMAGPALAKEVQPMYGGWMTAGYDWGAKPQAPTGTIAYDAKKNQFQGTYSGLHMPPGRRAIFAWLHDTVNQKTRSATWARWAG